MLQRFARSPLWVVAVATVSASMAGCSGDDGRIYDAFKCANVALILGRKAEASAATMKVKPLLDQKTGNPAEYMMRMRDKYTDDLALYKLSPQGQLRKVSEIFESGTCQELYR